MQILKPLWSQAFFFFFFLSSSTVYSLTCRKNLKFDFFFPFGDSVTFSRDAEAYSLDPPDQ